MDEVTGRGSGMLGCPPSSVLGDQYASRGEHLRTREPLWLWGFWVMRYSPVGEFMSLRGGGPTAQSVVVRLVVHGKGGVGNRGEDCPSANAALFAAGDLTLKLTWRSRHWILGLSG